MTIRCLTASAVGARSTSNDSGAEAPIHWEKGHLDGLIDEIMEILDAYDLTGSYRDTAELAGCIHHPVKSNDDARAAGGSSVGLRETLATGRRLTGQGRGVGRPAQGKVRTDKVNGKMVCLGYTGSERTTRRGVAEVRAASRVGHRRVNRSRVVIPSAAADYAVAVQGDSKSSL